MTRGLDMLLDHRIGEAFVARDWTLLREIADAALGPPAELEATDPDLFARWTAAVAWYRAAGYRHMTRGRIDEVLRGRPDIKDS